MGGARLRCLGGADQAQIGSHLIDVLPLKCLLLTGYRPIDEEYTRNPVIQTKDTRSDAYIKSKTVLLNKELKSSNILAGLSFHCHQPSLVGLKLMGFH